jgi:hypothetical protein
MKGEIIGKLPPPSSRGEDYDWDAMALLAMQHPGDAVLAAEHVRESRVKSLRQYTRYPFVQQHGHITVAVRNSSVEADGIRYGDVYFIWNEFLEGK